MAPCEQRAVGGYRRAEVVAAREVLGFGHGANLLGHKQCVVVAVAQAPVLAATPLHNTCQHYSQTTQTYMCMHVCGFCVW